MVSSCINSIFCLRIPYANKLLLLLVTVTYDDVGKLNDADIIAEPVPFATMLVTIEIDADNIVASFCVADDAEMYCCAPVVLIFDTVFLKMVGVAPIPPSKMLIIVLNEPVMPFTLEPEIIIPLKYGVELVTFNNPAAFFTNVGNEPVPFLTISNTILNELLDDVINVFAMEAVVWYWEEVVILTNPFTFETNVGMEPVPFSIISKTISNPVVTLFCSDSGGVIDDVI